MADKERDKKINPPKLPKTNYQTWLILALIVVIFGISRVMNSGELTEILDSRFEEMVRSRDIKKLVLIKNEEMVEITLKAEALQNAKYKQEIEKTISPLGLNANGPHYKLKIGSVEKFEDRYEELTKGFSAHQYDFQYRIFVLAGFRLLDVNAENDWRSRSWRPNLQHRKIKSGSF